MDVENSSLVCSFVLASSPECFGRCFISFYREWAYWSLWVAVELDDRATSEVSFRSGGVEEMGSPWSCRRVLFWSRYLWCRDVCWWSKSLEGGGGEEEVVVGVFFLCLWECWFLYGLFFLLFWPSFRCLFPFFLCPGLLPVFSGWVCWSFHLEKIGWVGSHSSWALVFAFNFFVFCVLSLVLLFVLCLFWSDHCYGFSPLL